MVSDEDAKRLARAVLSNFTRIDDSGKNAYEYCKFCGTRAPIDWDTYHWSGSGLPHGTDCVTLVAKDVLT